jgi:predicted CXXCH cytochrome family protein
VPGQGWSSWLGLALAGAVVAACQGQAGPPVAAKVVRGVSSNVLRRDYVGSAACAGCHAQVFEAWSRSPMHRMTRDVATTKVSAPFDGRSLRLGADEARLSLLEGQRFLALSRAGKQSLFRVTKVIGGRYREDFVGAQVSPDAPFGTVLDAERVLPVSFLRFDGTLRYKGYSVMVRERPGLEAGLVWQQACVLCHNTAPQLTALYDELHGPGAPSYQGSASSELPEDRSFRYVIDDAEGLRHALEEELHFLGAQGGLPRHSQHALQTAIANTRERFAERHLVELGVGCESCHGGARAHAEAPQRVRTSFAAVSPFFHVETAAGGELTPAQQLNRACAKCHTVLFSQYPYTWEGGLRRQDPGGSTTNSGEARDFLLGGCASQLACTHCHDPHGQDSPGKLEQLGRASGNRVCTGCHSGFSGETALKAHTHHLPASEGSACLNCHMPKKNMGLAYEFTRYHRIGSPTDDARVLGDRPLDCALCHADRSVDQIVSTMERWWGKRYDRARLRRLYGADLSKNPLRLTLLGGHPHEQALAADAAVRQQLDDTTDAIASLLSSEYPLVRYFARHSLERRFGEPMALEMSLPGRELEQAGRAWLLARTPR